MTDLNSFEDGEARAESLAPRLADHAAAVDRAGAFPDQEFAWLDEAGLLRAPLPRRDGGCGMGTAPGATGALLSALRHLGRGNLSVGRLYEGHVNALALIYRFGTRAQQKRYAEDARSGKCFAVWNTETGPGGLRLARSRSGYELEGGKSFASGAGHVARPLVTGALEGGGWQMLVLPADEMKSEVDRSSWQPVGMRASASYSIDFSGASVSGERLVGAPGDYHREPWFSAGAIRFAAVQLGGAEALLSLTRTHLGQRNRTEDPHQRRRVAQMATAIESSHLLLKRAARLSDAFDRSAANAARAGEAEENPAERAPAARLIAYANMTRSAVERTCLGVLEHAERSIGAQGMLHPHPLERVARDLTVYLRQPAPDAALGALGAHVLKSDRPAHALWPHE